MTSRTSTTLIFAFTASLLGACGGKSDDIGDSGTDSSPPSTSCPSAQPSEGDSCAREGLECEYGNDPRASCDQIVTCTSGSWSVSFGGDPSCPTPANPVECPTTVDQAAGSCNSTGLSCNYTTSSATLFCTCGLLGGPILADGGPSAQWYCGGDVDQGCPSLRPRIGTSCSQAGLDCSYDVCGAPRGLSFTCDATTATWAIGPDEACAVPNGN